MRGRVWEGGGKGSIIELRMLEKRICKSIYKGLPWFLPGELYGQRRLAGCSPWGREEVDASEELTLASSIRVIGRLGLLFKKPTGKNHNVK